VPLERLDPGRARRVGSGTPAGADPCRSGRGSAPTDEQHPAAGVRRLRRGDQPRQPGSYHQYVRVHAAIVAAPIVRSARFGARLVGRVGVNALVS